MRLNCPACSTMLDLNDALVKKLVRCPKCEQSFVVPEIAPPLVAVKADVKQPRVSTEYELGPSADEHLPSDAPADPNSLKFCPGCGAPWKKGATECKKCHFVPALGAQLKPREKSSRGLAINLQSVYLLIFAVAVIYCGYWVIQNWNWVKSSINSIWSH